MKCLKENLKLLLKSFIANVLKCNACLKVKFKCELQGICYNSIYSLMMSPFYKNGNRLIKLKYQQCFNLINNYVLICVQYSRCASFLNGIEHQYWFD